MKYGYREIRKLSSSSLRALCIKEDWYTGGDNAEYYNLMRKVDNMYNITTDNIVELATDIIEHSATAKADFEKATGGEDFYLHVMYLIAEACYSIFEIAE